MSPEIDNGCGQKDKSIQGWTKADGVDVPEGSSPGMRNGEYPRTPPGSESRACIHRGNSGTGESRLSPCTITVGGTDLSDRETPGDEEEAFALHRANKERRYKVSGEDSEERTSLRWAVGSLSGT